MSDGRSDAETRILILAPTGRDARLIANTLSGAQMSPVICEDLGDLIARLQDGAAAGLIAQEGLLRGGVEKLSGWLSMQPPWSDLPLVVLTSGGRPSRITVDQAHEIEALGNVTLIERPVRPDTILSSVRAALRARKRQYEMRRHEERLTRANRDLEQFAHSASHDLQEPLRAVAIYSELLEEKSADSLDDQARVFLGYLRSGARRMEMLVRDLLTYTQTAGMEDNGAELIDAGEQLEIALANLKQAIEDSDAMVTHDTLPPVRIKGAHLQELFQNLIGNAIKYRGADPLRVHVSATPAAGGFWRFAVTDNGIGIEKQFHEQIFGIFKRLHTNDKYPGTGIGLAICQRIAERYGGRIGVESESGKGSTFFFTLPAG
jgi:signal transduction histidine kinase